MSVMDATETTQFLTFILDDEVFAVNITQVREVLDFTTITKVPRTPEFLIGVINLRGAVIPVVDMRKKFGIEGADRTVNSCIVIMEISLDGESTVLGALVDSVQEVLDLEADQIEPAPRIGTRLKTEFIHGMGKRDDEFIIILDINKVFSVDELKLEQSASGEVIIEQAVEEKNSVSV